MQVLALDMAGNPRKWVSSEEAVIYYAKEMIAYDFGETTRVFRGGIRRNGLRSEIEIASIIGVRGPEFMADDFDREPILTNEKLFTRDRHVCAFCGERFKERELSRDHVVPASRGGQDNWMNLVTSCRVCNARKRNRTPEEAAMPLLYLPYVPSRWEDFILRNRNILADQMQFLLAKVPRASRMHA